MRCRTASTCRDHVRRRRTPTRSAARLAASRPSFPPTARRSGLPSASIALASGADAGFTLVEVVVALALFALIAAAGAALVSTVLAADRHTAGRLDRLADRDRTLALVGRDLTEIADGPLIGTAAGIAFDRHRAGGAAGVVYRIAGDRLERVAAGRPAVLLDHITGVRWSYLAVPAGWQDRWPAGTGQALTWPTAVAIEFDNTGEAPAGRLRRVVDLPARPLPQGAAG